MAVETLAQSAEALARGRGGYSNPLGILAWPLLVAVALMAWCC